MDHIRLLIVDNDNNYRELIKTHIDAEGYFIDEAADGISALKLFRRNDYNLIIIETVIPELEGKIVCKQIRKVSDVPIIIISTISDELNKLSCYELGVDDYIIKPFSPAEFLAKVKVLLRRSGKDRHLPSRTISYGGIHIDTVSRMVYINEKEVQLTPKEYELLLFLLKNPNKAFSREVLLNEVWGYDFFGSDRTVDTHIKTLRENLKPFHQYIVTIWGYGYKFEV